MRETLGDRVRRHEGFSLFPYIDTTGNATIGIGHKLTKDEALDYTHGITEEQALEILESDLAKARLQANTFFPWLLGLDDIRQGVIYEMVYQLGARGVAAFKHMIAAIRVQDWAKAANAMLDSVWHDQTPSRCEELANLMLNGDEA